MSTRARGHELGAPLWNWPRWRRYLMSSLRRTPRNCKSSSRRFGVGMRCGPLAQRPRISWRICGHSPGSCTYTWRWAYLTQHIASPISHPPRTLRYSSRTPYSAHAQGGARNSSPMCRSRQLLLVVTRHLLQHAAIRKVHSLLRPLLPPHTVSITRHHHYHC